YKNKVNDSPLSTSSSESETPENVLSQNPPIPPLPQYQVVNNNQTPEITLHMQPIQYSNNNNNNNNNSDDYRPPTSVTIPVMVPTSLISAATIAQFVSNSQPIPPPPYYYASNNQDPILAQPTPSAAYTPGSLNESGQILEQINLMSAHD
ncbi:MAG: hypothetical protein EZS28_037876, partial [Streblomastix strix]